MVFLALLDKLQDGFVRISSSAWLFRVDHLNLPRGPQTIRFEGACFDSFPLGAVGLRDQKEMRSHLRP
jgi:hypothetical protein